MGVKRQQPRKHLSQLSSELLCVTCSDISTCLNVDALEKEKKPLAVPHNEDTVPGNECHNHDAASCQCQVSMSRQRVSL